MKGRKKKKGGGSEMDHRVKSEGKNHNQKRKGVTQKREEKYSNIGCWVKEESKRGRKIQEQSENWHRPQGKVLLAKRKTGVERWRKGEKGTSPAP